jgi:hypothetical protein
MGGYIPPLPQYARKVKMRGVQNSGEEISWKTTIRETERELGL